MAASPVPPLAALLHPGLLALGAGLAAVPVVIHLLSRRRVRPVRWAAMQWLLAALKKHQRRLRFENLIVLLLRVAAVVLLGLGVARWIWSDASFVELAPPKRSVAILLDTSASTGARDGARSVSDRVRAEAERVLQTLGSDDALAVVVSNDVRPDRTGTRPFLLVPRSVGRDGVSRAKEALGLVRPTEAPASWPDALVAASPRTVFGPDDVNRVLVWITDLQAVDWRPPGPDRADPLRETLASALRDGPIEVVDVGGAGTRALPNLAVLALGADHDRDLFQGGALTLKVQVGNHGSSPVTGASLRVFLDDAAAPVRVVRLDSLPAADPIEFAPGTREVVVPVEKALSFRTPGAHSVRVEVTPGEGSASADALALDSRRHLALDVRSTLKILAWTEPSAQARTTPADVLKGVFEGDSAGDVFALRLASGEDDCRRLLGTWEPDVVVLANRTPRGAATQRDLVSFVRGGGALVVFAGDAFDAPAWNAAFHASREARLSPFLFGSRRTRDRRGSEGAWSFDLSGPTPHVLSKSWLGDDHVRRWLASVPPDVWGRMPLVLPETTAPRSVTPTTGHPPGEEAIVLRFARDKTEPEGPGPVAAVESPFGQGRVLLFGTALDDDWAGGGIAFFLPIVLYDSALALTRQQDEERNVLVGRPLSGPVPRDATNLRIQGPGRGEETPALRAARDENARPSFSFERVGASGLWRLVYDRPSGRGGDAKQAAELFAAHVEPREGSLARSPHALVEARAGVAGVKVVSTFGEAAERREEARQGEVTTWVLVLVALVLLLEPWLAMRFGRHGHTAHDGPPAS